MLLPEQMGRLNDILKNSGKIVMRTNSAFDPPIGALVDISCGEILLSNNF